MTWRILHGDAIEVLRTLPEASARCCVTSPPYFGLRDYGTASWVGGDPACEHKGRPKPRQDTSGATGPDHGRFAATRGTQPAKAVHVIPVRGTCPCGAERVDSQIGLEETPAEYIARLVDLYREVRRVLTDDGTLWLNIGDSYAGSWGAQSRGGPPSDKSTLLGNGHVGGGPKISALSAVQVEAAPKRTKTGTIRADGIKPKDLYGIPWTLALALRADGWYLRSDIIWCLSGGARVYVRTPSGDRPMSVRDLSRLRPETVSLWNGEKWTRLLGISCSGRRGDEIELVLRSGERISCTPTHRFPTQRGLLDASHIAVGDILQACVLPEPENPSRPESVPDSIGWLVGLYLAEGSRSGGTIQISGHVSERESRLPALQRVAAAYGGTCRWHDLAGQSAVACIESPVLAAILDLYVAGATAHDKHLSSRVWARSNEFLRYVMDGYIHGDGHYDVRNDRWRLGFTRNYAWEADLRTLCARLNTPLTLNLSTSSIGDVTYQTFRGELRWTRGAHHNTKDRAEVVAIRRARAREFYDLGVEDEPHLFALASGILTHNSKPNPMPESVRDRPTKSHEYLFLLSKSERYFYNIDAIREPHSTLGAEQNSGRWERNTATSKHAAEADGAMRTRPGSRPPDYFGHSMGRNRRTVWTITTQPFPDAHFAVMPEALVEPCILAGSEPGDTVIDPMCGAATVGVVALRNGRNFVGCDLNGDYVAMGSRRIVADAPLWNTPAEAQP